MRPYILAIVTFLVLHLTGCQTWSNQQIKTASDDELCRHYHDSNQWKGAVVDLTDVSTIENELSKRNLNCDHAFRYCQSIGTKAGTDTMVDCVMTYNKLKQQKSLEQQQIKTQQKALEQQQQIDRRKTTQDPIIPSRHSTTTDCITKPYGGGVTCTTH